MQLWRVNRGFEWLELAAGLPVRCKLWENLDAEALEETREAA